MRKRATLIGYSAFWLAILAIALSSGNVLVWRVFLLVSLVPPLGYLWAAFSIRGITARVNVLAEHCQVGSSFDEEINVFSNSRMPRLLIKLEENTDLPGHSGAAVLNLSPKGRYRWQNTVYCRRRGRYKLGVFTLTATDPFGLFAFKRTLGEPSSIIIHPAAVDLPFFRALSRRELGPGSSRWLVSEVGQDASGVREYTGGDTFKHVHWRSTAHMDKLMVKEFDAVRPSHAPKQIWIALDMHQAVQTGEGDAGTEESGVMIAASLARRLSEEGEQVGLTASGDQPYLFPPEAGSHHLWKILDALALIKADGQVPIGQLISNEMRFLDSNSLVVIVTPLPAERLAAPLQRLRNRGVAAMVISLAPSTAGKTGRILSAAGKTVSFELPVRPPDSRQTQRAAGKDSRRRIETGKRTKV